MLWFPIHLLVSLTTLRKWSYSGINRYRKSSHCKPYLEVWKSTTRKSQYGISIDISMHCMTILGRSLHSLNFQLRQIFFRHNMRATDIVAFKHQQTQWKLEAGHSIECIPHAGHSIAFLHFVTLRLWPLTLWWVMTRDGLSLCQVWRFQFQPFWFYRADKQRDRQTDRQTEAESQTQLNALLPRLSSAWVIIYCTTPRIMYNN